MSNILLNSLKEYYSDKNKQTKLIDILNNNNEVSLRIIDWFVTNYSKKYNVMYFINGDSFSLENSPSSKLFNVYYSYKTQLKSYSKKKFDPFCRRDRIQFKLGEHDIVSTIGQLNFFKWAINNHILEYIIMNYKSIENDMNISYNNINKKKNKDIRKKRQEISKSATRGLNTYNVKVLIDFD